jgi:hypothetical protein
MLLVKISLMVPECMAKFVMDHKLPGKFNHHFKFGKNFYSGLILIFLWRSLPPQFRSVRDILTFI